MKLLGFFIVVCLSAQTVHAQTVRVKSLKNFDRTRYWQDNMISETFADSLLLMPGGSTLSKVIYANKEGGLLTQRTRVNGKNNGLSVEFWPNGIVNTVDYYFDGMLWEVISFSDSLGRIHHPGTLRNGNGTVNFYDAEGKHMGFRTYQNGHLSGPYRLQGDAGTESRGNLIYKPASVSYFPAKDVTFVMYTGDTLTYQFSLDDYKRLFSDSTNHPVKVRDTILPVKQDFPYIYIFTEDPAEIPTGHWVVSDPRTGKTVLETDYDDNGNVIQVIMYDAAGKIALQQKFPSCNKRKLVKYNEDGSFYGESCHDELKK